MRISEKTVKIIIVVLTIFTLINVCAIIHVNALLNAPQTTVQTEVLGAVFKPEDESDVIEINLVRPPRKVVTPGDISEQNMTLVTQSEFYTYFRGAYKVVVENSNGEIVSGFESKVIVNVNENWEYQNGYWYYKERVEPNETIVGLIDSIEYSNDFSDHLDYKVYVPMVIESVEVRESGINEVDYWPNYDINEVDYKRLNESMKWTTTTKFNLIG